MIQNISVRFNFWSKTTNQLLRKCGSLFGLEDLLSSSIPSAAANIACLKTFVYKQKQNMIFHVQIGYWSGNKRTVQMPEGNQVSVRLTQDFIPQILLYAHLMRGNCQHSHTCWFWLIILLRWFKADAAVEVSARKSSVMNLEMIARPPANPGLILLKSTLTLTRTVSKSGPNLFLICNI